MQVGTSRSAWVRCLVCVVISTETAVRYASECCDEYINYTQLYTEEFEWWFANSHTSTFELNSSVASAYQSLGDKSEISETSNFKLETAKVKIFKLESSNLKPQTTKVKVFKLQTWNCESEKLQTSKVKIFKLESSNFKLETAKVRNFKLQPRKWKSSNLSLQTWNCESEKLQTWNLKLRKWKSSKLRAESFQPLSFDKLQVLKPENWNCMFETKLSKLNVESCWIFKVES